MFQGFSEKTIDFLWGVRFHNEKMWYESHRDEYLAALYEPMRALSPHLQMSRTPARVR